MLHVWGQTSGEGEQFGENAQIKGWGTWKRPVEGRARWRLLVPGTCFLVSVVWRKTNLAERVASQGVSSKMSARYVRVDVLKWHWTSWSGVDILEWHEREGPHRGRAQKACLEGVPRGRA
jgi:hypothetical protein